MRCFEVHRHRHFFHKGAACFEVVGSRAHFRTRRLIADRMMEALLEEANAQALSAGAERLHVVADPGVDRARVMRIGARYRGQELGDVLGARAYRSAVIDRI